MHFPIALDKNNDDANTIQLDAFVVYCWRFGMNRRNEGNKHTTISGKVSAIRWQHQRLFGYCPGVDSRHKLLMNGVKRLSDPVEKKHPVSTKMLRRIYSGLDLTRPKNQLLWGLMLLGYFFLLRRSEYFLLEGVYYEHVLQYGDLNFYNEDEEKCSEEEATMVGMLLRGAKNNQYGRLESRYQFKSGDDVLCPVLAVRWIKKAGAGFGTKQDEPVSNMGIMQGVSVGAIVKYIKMCALASGLNPWNFSSHSLRVGGSTSLPNNQCSPLVIKLLGRWNSDCYQAYPVLLPSGCRGISRLMC